MDVDVKMRHRHAEYSGNGECQGCPDRGRRSGRECHAGRTWCAGRCGWQFGDDLRPGDQSELTSPWFTEQTITSARLEPLKPSLVGIAPIGVLVSLQMFEPLGLRLPLPAPDETPLHDGLPYSPGLASGKIAIPVKMPVDGR